MLHRPQEVKRVCIPLLACWCAQANDDFVHINSYYSNTGGVTPSSWVARELHLDRSLVPLAQTEHVPLSRPNPSLSPSRRISAIRFEDRTKSPAAGLPLADMPPAGSPSTSSSMPAVTAVASASSHAGASPQRVYVDGQWRLRTSLGTSASSPSLPSRQPAGDIGKQPVHVPIERLMQLDNRALADSRTAHSQAERRVRLEDERSALDDWGARWGYPGTAHKNDSPTRRRYNPSASQPTLIGFAM